MHLGLLVPNFTFLNNKYALGDTFAQIAQRAERAGFYSLWVMDHFFQVHLFGSPEMEMLEGWSTLAFAAGVTNHIKLGIMVTGVTYHHPGLLIKTATTLDVLSHGRTYFGIGAAWYEEEHRGLGVPFPSTAERFERLEETLQIAHQMWRGDEKPFKGKHYTLERPLNSPQSVPRPHPPILIGGIGERKTLRMVAQYADGCNFPANLGKNELQHKLDVLRDHCQSLGRPYEEIEKTTVGNYKETGTTTVGNLAITRDGRNDTLSPKAALDQFAALAEIGIDHAVIILHNITDIEAFDVLATQIIPEVEKIRVAGR